MSKRVNIELEKEELEMILQVISMEANPALYEKLNAKYNFILHQEKAVSLIEENYKERLVSCELSYFNELKGLLHYKVLYNSINQETYEREMESTSEVVKIIDNEDEFSYEMMF